MLNFFYITFYCLPESFRPWQGGIALVMMIQQLVLPFFSLLVNILAQIISFKYILKRNLLKSEYLGFISGFLAYIFYEAVLYKYSFSVMEWIGLVTANCLIYLCFSYYYFNFINLGETARRIRLLRELSASPEGLTEKEILKRYNADEIIAVRMERLLNNKQVIMRAGRYYIGNPTMLLISKLIVVIKLIVLGKRSEFDS